MNLEATVLNGRHVRLEPVKPDDRATMRALLDCDPDHWEIAGTNGSGEGFDGWWRGMSDGAAENGWITYLIRDRRTGGAVGTSSLINLRPAHRGVEIGATFLSPAVRGSAVNPESKLLMLAYAFDAGAVRVEFMIDVRNARSQAAVSKLGATREGVLRRHKITWTGHVRDTAVFSITDADWPGVRDRLAWRLQESFV